MTRTRTTRYITLLSVVLALALTAALAACGSDEPSGVTGPARTASTPALGDAPTATDAPAPATATAPPTATVAPRPTATRPPLPTIGPTSAETDREALVALYNATDGENWWASTNWLSDAPLGQWFSVITNDDGRVTGLELWDNDLSGEVPAELGSSNLVWLRLNDNDLSGCAPSSLEDQLDFVNYSNLGDLPFC